MVEIWSIITRGDNILPQTVLLAALIAFLTGNV